MKRIIKWALGHLPRTFMQRIAGAVVPVMGLFYIGRGRQCPVCGTRRRKFLPYGYVASREDALCPSCLALERHRLLWLFLLDRTTAGGDPRKELRFAGRMLHIAPEVCLRSRFERLMKDAGGEYLTADLCSPLADLHFDVQDIPLPDHYADIIVCNHLLEHVADDRRAMREMHRIMRPGGWGIMLSPVELSRERTFEDDSITDPAERTRVFGQYDHRRIYGRDYAGRLREAGFAVEECDFAQTLPPELRRLCALTDERIYLVRK